MHSVIHKGYSVLHNGVNYTGVTIPTVCNPVDNFGHTVGRSHEFRRDDPPNG